jgi:hypothetical protein
MKCKERHYEARLRAFIPPRLPKSARILARAAARGVPEHAASPESEDVIQTGRQSGDCLPSGAAGAPRDARKRTQIAELWPIGDTFPADLPIALGQGLI